MDLDAWKGRVTDRLRRFARHARAEVERSGPHLLYGGLAGMALWPVAEAVQGGELAALGALYSLGAGVGVNLLANQVQTWKDEADAAEKLARTAQEDAEVRAALDTVLARLEVLPTLEAALSDDDREWFAGLLRDELRRSGSRLVVSAAGRGIVQIGKHNIAVSGDVEGGVTIVQGDVDRTDPAALRQAYLWRLQSECGHLPLRGVDLEASDAGRAAQRLNLANVYVELDTTVQVPADAPPGEVISTALKDSLSLDRQGKHPAGKDPAADKVRRATALECVAPFRHVVLLGDPGGGKSTFINHLASILAAAQLAADITPFQARYPVWHDNAWNLLPLPLRLRDLVRGLAAGSGQGTAKLLWDQVESWLARCDLAEFGLHLKGALHAGQVLVLLDGLDEVPTAGQRRLVRDAVADFAATYRQARLLVTCRTLSYQDERWKLPPDFAVFELAPFDAKKIDNFIAAWYAELEVAGTVRPGEGRTLAGRLSAAVRRPDLWRLAPNPLLLTVMALVHTHKGRLPEARALLYEECVDMLLWRWEQLKLRAEGEDEAGLRRLLLDAGLQTVDLKRTLWRLAYEVHAQDRTGDDGLADLHEGALLRALRDLHPKESWDWAQAVVDQVRERAGLLVERQPGIYTFPHRTFQEYLAASHLSVDRRFGRHGARLARQGGARWREVILLAVGRLVHHQGETDRPLALVAELCPAAEPANDEDWRATWLAGEVLCELGLPRARETHQGRDLLDRVRARLSNLVEGGALTPRERAEAGDVLSWLGDPRFDPDALRLPCRFRGEPETLLGFLPVPDAEFQMGSKRYDREQPIHPVPLGEYYVSRYPVTNAQYAAFVQATDREPPRHWDGPEPPVGLRHHPVVYVSWHDARAYGAWLTGQLRQGVALPPPLAARLCDQRWVVRLPTEAEWERAASWDAQSGQARQWPWGNGWDATLCNTFEGGIGTTTAVGLFPGGASPCGALDMAGNAWEWCQSLYKDYPYRSEDGREDLEAGGSRVLRGGAFSNLQGSARCAVRVDDHPAVHWDSGGFRLVVSPALPSDS